MMLLQAGYTTHQQYEHLFFHFNVIVPRLGPKPPPDGNPRVQSFMTDDFTPIEYSWNWNTASSDSQPIVRYGIEAIGPQAGTVVDPFNQASTTELLHELKNLVPNIDLTLFEHFRENLFRASDVKRYLNEFGSYEGSTMFLAPELARDEIFVKGYFIPVQAALPVGQDVSDAITAAVKKLNRDNTAIDAYLQFTATDPCGSSLRPFMLGIDCVAPKESRFKIYVRSANTSFSHVCNIITMGGLRKIQPSALADLRELWRLTLNLSPDFSDTAELPRKDHQTSGMCYYFDIKPGSALPDIKCYIPVRHYSQNDLQVARGLSEFLRTRGRGSYIEGFMHVLEALGSRSSLGSSCGVQTYISVSFGKDDLSLTSYLSPEVYRKGRKGRERRLRTGK